LKDILKDLKREINDINTVIEDSKKPPGFSVKPIIDEEVRKYLEKYKNHITRVSSLVSKIIAGNESFDTASIINRYAAHFENLLKEYSNIKNFLKEGRKENFMRVTAIFWGMVVVWCTIIGAFFIFLYYFLKKNSETMSKIEISEERFRYMAESIQDGILIIEEDKPVYINNRMCEILGRTKEEILKTKKAEEFISAQDREKMIELKREAISKSLPYVEIECWNERNDGTLAYVQHRYSARKTEEGKTYRYIVTTDLTEKKLAEERMEHLAKIFESSLNEIYILDAETLKFIEVNKAARDNLGYSLDELREMTPLDLKPEMTWEKIREITREVDSGEKKLVKFQAVHTRKDGSKYPVEIYIQKILYESKPCHLCMVLDISSRIEAEEEQKRLLEAINQSWDIIMITDKEGVITYVNDSFERITGYKKEEAIGRTPAFLKSGLQDENFYKELWATLLKGETWKGRLINRKKDGSLYNEDATISPIKDTKGNNISYVAVMRDVSREVEMEAQLLQAQKMEAIGRLAGGIAHDFNNLLVGIIGYSELLKETLPSEMETAQRYINEIVKAGERASSLTKQLLAFGRKQIFRPQIIDVNNALKNTEMMLKRIIGEDIKVEIKTNENINPIKADPDHISQIMLNLATNARDAMPNGGKFIIETTNVYLDEFFVKNHRGAKEGAYVLITVSDNGCGMDKETLSHVFEPFFTTKDVDKGTGLGLSTVYGIVKQNNGYISVYSEIGRGTTFKIYLPVAEGMKKEEISELFLDKIPEGNETILVVEDEEVVRKMTKEILEQLGYKVLSASNADEGLLILKNSNENIDLLLTDIVMPDMRGDILAKEIKKLNSGIKIMFMSGYAEAIIAKEDGLFGDNVVIQKPFTSRELAIKIRKAIEGS
ncbi:MAG: PAS domain S-box protein, partial [Candidatus Schekmanbacteria bacterium]